MWEGKPGWGFYYWQVKNVSRQVTFDPRPGYLEDNTVATVFQAEEIGGKLPWGRMYLFYTHNRK